eukprot:147267-Pleurochrysis_carterae.AAC.1
MPLAQTLRVEVEGFGRLPLTQGLYERRRAARALQPDGQADAKGVPAVARRFVGAQAVRQQRGQELVSVGWREGRGVISSDLLPASWQ